MLLYQLLAGETPFAGPPHVVMANHLQSDPPPMSRWVRDVPRDLEAICLKALEKEPARRYASCAALAEDLARWQRGEPVSARPIGWGSRMVRWSWRNPLPAGLAAAVAAVLVLGIAVSTWFAVQVGVEADQKGKALEEKGKALLQLQTANVAKDNALQRQKEETQKVLRQFHTAIYVRQISEAQDRWRTFDVVGAEQVLSGCNADLRGWEWNHLHYLCRTNPTTLKGHSGRVWGVSFSPDGNRIASASEDKTVKVWDARPARNCSPSRATPRASLASASAPMANASPAAAMTRQ